MSDPKKGSTSFALLSACKFDTLLMLLVLPPPTNPVRKNLTQFIQCSHSWSIELGRARLRFIETISSGTINDA